MINYQEVAARVRKMRSYSTFSKTEYVPESIQVSKIKLLDSLMIITTLLLDGVANYSIYNIIDFNSTNPQETLSNEFPNQK